MSSRAEYEARQRELREQRRLESLAWTDELLERPTPELVQRALTKLGFRDATEYHGTIRDLVRLVRGRSSADWSFRDVEPLQVPPARYQRVGEIVEVRGELPSVVLSTSVEHGATLAFEVGLDHREWIVEHGG